MQIVDLLADMLDGTAGVKMHAGKDQLAEVRLRVFKPIQLMFCGGEEFLGEEITPQIMHAVLIRLMENSIYSREHELKRGYFTTAEGCRVGVCGKMNVANGRIISLSGIGSACIRIPRQMHGCADGIFETLFRDGPCGILILSPPGIGKTTLLRELIRKASNAGYNAAVADERHEIAACRDGIAQLDVGLRTDVLDGCSKSLALPMLIRSVAPKIVAMDEIGSCGEMKAILDSARCGVFVVATAHAGNIADALQRQYIAPLIRQGVFKYCVMLGPERGAINCLLKWANGRFERAEGNAAFDNSDLLRGGGQNHKQCTQASL